MIFNKGPEYHIYLILILVQLVLGEANYNNLGQRVKLQDAQSQEKVSIKGAFYNKCIKSLMFLKVKTCLFFSKSKYFFLVPRLQNNFINNAYFLFNLKNSHKRLKRGNYYITLRHAFASNVSFILRLSLNFIFKLYCFFFPNSIIC